MRRLSPFASLALGAVVAMGSVSPAVAKGVGYDHGEIQGPGLDRPIVAPNRSPYFLNAELFQMVAGRNAASNVPSPTTLGPRYSLTYHLTDGRRVLVQFYPDAAPRPLGFVLPGQTVHVSTDRGTDEVRLKSGWYEYPPPLVEMLRDRGLPLPSDRTSTWRPAAVAIALIALLLLLVRMITKFSRAQPHPT
jgi:hypothetical protein